MGTIKPISTISYNTKEYLEKKLNELIKAKKIQFYAFISHRKEEDERKDHIHLYIEPPMSAIKPMDLTEYLLEVDPNNISRPLKCMSWNKSEFDPWFLYSSHNKAYLASKGQSRKYHYSEVDFVTSDEDEFHYRVSNVDMFKLLPYRDMESAILAGLSFGQYFRQGRFPVVQINAYRMAWGLLLEDVTERRTRNTHTPIIDEETGEVIYKVKPGEVEPWMEVPDGPGLHEVNLDLIGDKDDD